MASSSSSSSSAAVQEDCLCLAVGGEEEKEEKYTKSANWIVARKNVFALVAMLALGFIGGILIAGRVGTSSHADASHPVTVTVHLHDNGQEASFSTSALPSERRFLKKSKSTKAPTRKPTSEPTVQATFPHGTSSPKEERRALKNGKKTSALTGTEASHQERRHLKKSYAKFTPQHETYNPTPYNLHPTKKPSEERRALKTSSSETYNPTPYNLHPTKKPSEQERKLVMTVVDKEEAELIARHRATKLKQQ